MCIYLGDAGVVYEKEYGGVVVAGLNTRRSVAETVYNSSLILAEGRTTRRDPNNDFKLYTGGWNISNGHYWSVSFSIPSIYFFSQSSEILLFVIFMSYMLSVVINI